MYQNHGSNTGLVAASSLASALFGIIGLLSSNSTYQDADKVRRMVTEAKSKVVPLTPRRTGR